jgi:hypothetical protein
MSATTAGTPQVEHGVLSTIIASPRSESHPRHVSGTAAMSLHGDPRTAPVHGNSNSNNHSHYDPSLMRRAESEESRRRFLGMIETLYDRAFDYPVSMAELSPRQQRLEELAEQVDQAGGSLDALVHQRVREELVALGDIGALAARVKRLEDHIGLKTRSEPSSRGQSVASDRMAMETEEEKETSPPAAVAPMTKQLVERIDKLEEQLDNNTPDQSP